MPVNFKKSVGKQTEKKPVAKQKKSSRNWFQKLLGLAKVRRSYSKEGEKKQPRHPSPLQFVHSKKPALQVDVRQKPPRPAKPKTQLDAKPAKDSVTAPKDDKKQPSTDINSKLNQPDLPLPSDKKAPDKRASFSSLKELVENEPEPRTEEFDVNLIPAELITADIKKNFIKKLVMAGVGSLLVVVIFYAGVSILGAKRQTEISTVKQEVEKLSGELDKAQDTLNRLSNFTKQASLVSEVLKGQKKWSQLFSLLEEETIPEVYYTSVSVSSNNEVGLSLVAKSYHDLARQYIIFQSNPHIKEISMGGANMNTEVWEEYLKELQLSAEREKLASEREEEVPEFKMPSFAQMQNLITVNSDFKFIYDFSQEGKGNNK